MPRLDAEHDGDADEHAGAQREAQPAAGERHHRHAGEEHERAAHHHRPRAVAIRIGADERLRHAPDDVLQREREGEVRDAEAQIARHRDHEEAEALAHAHGEAQHHRGAEKDRHLLRPRRRHGRFHPSLHQRPPGISGEIYPIARVGRPANIASRPLFSAGLRDVV
jgi:hypothetical protein